MTDQFIELEDEIDELESHQRQWIREVEDYYSNPEVAVGEYDEAPHDRLRRRAAEFVEVGIEYPKDNPRSTMNDVSPWEIHYQLVATGAEILLNAVVMKEDYDRFAELANYDLNWTPGIKKCAQWLTRNLPEGCSEAERQRVAQVLRLLRVHRHNSAHLGYYPMAHHRHPREVYRVLAFLFDHFFETDQIVDRLTEEVRAFDKRTSPVEPDYPPVDFDRGRFK